VEESFSVPVQTGPVAHPASETIGTGSFLGVKRLGRGVDHTPYLAPMLKKVKSYTSISLWPFVTCSRANCTFTFMLMLLVCREGAYIR